LNRCSRCILPDGYPGIDFDSDGVCSLCRSFEPGPSPVGESALSDTVSPYTGSGEKYDSIVAFSGGRDSSFILWYAVKRLGLRTLALFTDNGYAPAHTHRNLRRTSDILKVDLHIESYSSLKKTFPGMLRAWIRRPSAATVSLLCTGCSYGRRLKLPVTAQKYRIPLMIVGGGEPELSFAETLLASGIPNPSRKDLLKGFLEEVQANPYLLLSPGRSSTILKEFALRYLERRILRLLGIEYPKRKLFPYSYLGWNEKIIMDTITNELGWEKGEMCGTSWRSDCLIAPLKNYIYGNLLGFHKVNELLAGMVRIGQIDRETAMLRLPEESAIDPAFLDSFLRENGVSLAELDKAISRVTEI
jgi:hypothetical protein